MNVKELVSKNGDYIVEMRRHFHMHPELSFEEFETTKRIAEELDKMEERFNTVLDFSRTILEVNTSDVDMLEIVENHESVLREDKVFESIGREEALKNAQDREYGYFRLKKVIE